MQEMIERLRMQLRELMVEGMGAGMDGIRIRGMHDILASIDDRVETMKYASYCCPEMMGNEIRELLCKI